MRLSLAWIGTAAATAALVAAAPAAAAQPEIQLRLDPTPDWEIHLSPDAVLEGDWVESANVHRLDSAHLIFLPANQVGGGFWVASTDGSDAKRIGRSGDGPGEYRYVLTAVAHERGIHLFDPVALRRTVLNADFEVVHTNPLRLRIGPFAPSVLQDFAYVANGSVSYGRDAEEHVLHYFDASGDLIRSFDLSPTGGGANYRTLRADPDGTLWSAHRNQYRIDSWDVTSGQRTASLVREADWFVAHDGGEGGAPHPRTPQPPDLVDMELDADGRLWTQISVASDRWEEAFRPTGPDDHPEFGDFMLVDDDVAFDRVIEVIDAAAGCVLATRTFEDIPYLYFLGSGWAVSYTDELSPSWQLWRMELQPLANGDGKLCD